MDAPAAHSPIEPAPVTEAPVERAPAAPSTPDATPQPKGEDEPKGEDKPKGSAREATTDARTHQDEAVADSGQGSAADEPKPVSKAAPAGKPPVVQTGHAAPADQAPPATHMAPGEEARRAVDAASSSERAAPAGEPVAPTRADTQTQAAGAPLHAAPATHAAPRHVVPKLPVTTAPAHDTERPAGAAPAQVTAASGLSARLSLGIGGALWLSGGDAKLSRPVFFGLDLGYALTRKITIMARASSWLPVGELANEFFGAGTVYRFVAERLYVASALGVSLTRAGPVSSWSHRVQGLAIEADVGQFFPLSTHTALSVGAHFQIGTPLLGRKPDAFTSFLAGIFVAVGLR